MSDVLVGFDSALGGIESTELKFAISVAALGLLVFVLLTYRSLQSWISDRSRPLYGDLVSTVLLVGTCAFVLAVVLGVWEQTGTVRDAYTDHGINSALVPTAIASFILLVGTLIVTRFIRRLIDEVLGSSSAVTAHQREITHRVAQVIIWSVSLVVVLGVWIDDLGGLLVGAGFLGIVVGMAARQTLGTILAGFVMMFDRPFEIGDWVVVDDEQGIVTDISIVNTRIRSFDGEYIMIPNDVIASSMVTNRSKRGRLRIEIDVGIDYDTDVEHAASLADSTVADLECALSAPSPRVVSKEFGDSAVVLGVRFWIDDPSARRVSNARTAAINAIKREYDDAGITIPYPQRQLSDRPRADSTRVTDDGGHAGPDRRDDRERGLTPREDD